MLFNRQKRRPLIELPRCLKLELLDEAQHIVHKTLQSESVTQISHDLYNDIDISSSSKLKSCH